MMRRREQKILDRLKQRAALVRPAFLRSFGIEPHELGCSQETCPACDGSGAVFRLRPDPLRQVDRERELDPAPAPGAAIGCDPLT
jgi:hypothetical protein